MSRILILIYGVVAYVLAMASVLYAIGFVENIVVPKSIDVSSQSAPTHVALIVNTLLLGLFAVQHSVMARQPFKAWITRMIPAAIERSTYVLASALLLFLLFCSWIPMPDVIWSVSHPFIANILTGISLLGWGIVLVSTFLINHWDLFGLRQVFANWQQKPLAPPEFRTPLLYKIVRHPIYFGFLLAFWFAPVMTLGHLYFAIATTGYILIGVWLEERDLLATFGDAYKRYRERVPMLIPWPFGGKKK